MNNDEIIKDKIMDIEMNFDNIRSMMRELYDYFQITVDKIDKIDEKIEFLTLQRKKMKKLIYNLSKVVEKVDLTISDEFEDDNHD